MQVEKGRLLHFHDREQSLHRGNMSASGSDFCSWILLNGETCMHNLGQKITGDNNQKAYTISQNGLVWNGP